MAVEAVGFMEAAGEEASTVAAVASTAEGSAEAADTRVTAHRAAAPTAEACCEAGSMAADSGAELLRMDSVPVGLRARIDLPARRGAQ